MTPRHRIRGGFGVRGPKSVPSYCGPDCVAADRAASRAASPAAARALRVLNYPLTRAGAGATVT